MERLDRMIFGYTRLEFDPKDLPRVTNLTLKLGICATFRSDGGCVLLTKDAKRLLASGAEGLVKGRSEPMGFPGFVRRNRYRVGTLLGILAVLFMYFFLGTRVWDVRIVGSVDLPEHEIRRTLEEAGLYVGVGWSDTDKSEIQNKVLESLDEVGWISINRVGGVAYVELLPAVGDMDEEPPSAYANIVATSDCVITSITVKQGKAVVSVGDTVRKGDLLISGIVEGEKGVTLCRAEGVVEGECAVELSVTVPRAVSVSVSEEPRLDSLGIEIFGFSLNILKNRGNCTDGCDIIEQRDTPVVDGRLRFPVSVVRTYVSGKRESTVEYTDAEMIRLASRRLNELMLLRFADADLLRLKSSGGFVDGVYRMSCYAVVCTDVAEVREIN
ncbi:MAG: sporulation protein YqfD [Clostridia bacterium]|nr:sporulation protein YqfD [Clostridia bacterium]